MVSMYRHFLDRPELTRLIHREQIDWHYHVENQLAYPSTGVLRVSTMVGSWVVPPQRAVWMPAGVGHRHRAHGATALRTLAFPPEVNPLGLTQPTVLAVSPLLREVVVALTDDPDLDPAERAELERVALRRLDPVPAPRFHLPSPVDDRLRDVAMILADDPADDRPLAALGRAVGAGERTLSRLFRRDTGMTFPQWRAQLRLHHSLVLLATGESVTATATACGYRNPSAFTAAFRETFGTTPGEHRSVASPR